MFVDDDQRILESLQRMLRPMRQEWTMTFVRGGEEALARLQGERFDVVVTDMQMPDMDGASLLEILRERYPGTARIVLSGQTSQEAALRSVRVAHQHLQKPCEPGALKAAVERVGVLSDQLGNAELQELLAGLQTVPALPSAYQTLSAAVERESSTFQEVGDIVAADPGLAAKLLQIVNSAFFGLPQSLASPQAAVRLLGMDLVRAMVLGAAVFTSGDPSLARRFAIDRLWLSSQQASVLCKLIAAHLGLDRAQRDIAQSAALLQGVGQAVLAFGKPEVHADSLQRAEREGQSICSSEESVLGCNYAQVGAYLLGLWALPVAVVEAVALSPHPLSLPQDNPGPLTAVHAAVALLAETRTGPPPFDLCEDYFQSLDLLGDLDHWRAMVGELER
jgi:HD-like signal output (HDOD) protein